MNFDLTKNAFALLATTPRADRTQIDDAFHDALLSTDAHEDETVLNRAQQSLISPRDRLENELSYFIDTKPATIHKIVAALRDGEAAHFIDDLAGLDRANLLAHLCYVGHIDARRKAALELVEVHCEINPSDVGEAITAARSISGFGTIEKSAVLSGLKRLRQLHAKAIIAGFGSDDRSQADIARLAESLIDSSPARQSILEAVLKEYEAEVSPSLELAAASVHSVLDQILKDPSDPKLLSSFNKELSSWDRIAQPLQVADRARGIDEHHSRQLFESIRDVCLNLANERKLYKPSLYLCQKACEVFSELPDAARKLSEDVTQLSELADWSEKEESLTPLVNAIAVAEKNHRSTWNALRKSGFQANANSPVEEIHTSFVTILSSKNDIELNGVAAMLVRQLAISLCNDSNNSRAGIILIEGLLDRQEILPMDVIGSLNIDLITLQNNIDFADMTTAIKERHLNKAEEIVRRLLVSADDETRKNLLQIQSSIASQKSQRKVKLIGGGVFAAVVALVIFLEQPAADTAYDENSYSYETTEDPSEDALTALADAAAVSNGEQVDPNATNEGDAPIVVGDQLPADEGIDISTSNEETPPAENQPNQVVGLSELRYCRKQQKRIEAVQGTASSELQISRFNEAVDNFNGRCGSVRYRQSDMAVIDSEIASERSKLRSEGEQIIGSVE